MPEATGKVCIICRQDCSNRPRIKDARGHYMCKSCAPARPSPNATPAAPAPLPLPSADADVPEIEVFEVMPDSLLGDGPSSCPGCNSPIPSGSVLCLACGFDVRKGSKLSTGTGIDDPNDPNNPPAKGRPAAAKCPECGYNLKGLKTPKCPECGKLVIPKSRHQLLQEESKKSARMEYIRPLIMLAVGLGGLTIFHLSRYDNEGLAASLIAFAIKVPSGAVAFWILCLIWFGFDAPLRLTVLRLAGIFAITAFADQLLIMTGLPILIYPVSFFLYYGLLMQELDIDDWKEALVLSLLMKVIAIAAIVSIAYLLHAQ